MCLYVINCLCVYFGWDYWNLVLEGYFSCFGHCVSKGKLVISLWGLFLVFQVETIIFTKLLVDCGH